MASGSRSEQLWARLVPTLAPRFPLPIPAHGTSCWIYRSLPPTPSHPRPPLLGYDPLAGGRLHRSAVVTVEEQGGC